VTGSVAGAHSAAAIASLGAVGVQRAAWLLLAFPIAGALILLLGGKRTNSWGHLVGVAFPVASFVYGLIAFATMLGYPASQRARDVQVYQWIPAGGLRVASSRPGSWPGAKAGVVSASRALTVTS
jgi:NADH-quinone oxidoreductase subunit L